MKNEMKKKWKKTNKATRKAGLWTSNRWYFSRDPHTV